jgi:putative aldouronate transport system permease protein
MLCSMRVIVSNLKRVEPPAGRVARTKTAGTGRGRFWVRQQAQLYLLLGLPMAFFLVFRYVPMAGLLMAFQDYNIFRGFFHSKWVGLEVFRGIFRMGDFWEALRNTLILNGLKLAIGFPAPILLALLLNEVRQRGLRKFFQSTLYLPYFLSWVIIGDMAIRLFADSTGLVNQAIVRAGGTVIPFLSKELHWVLTYQVISIWQSAGWWTIIYLSAMTAINPELYEAAEVDGAGRLQKIRFVTLPAISATTAILLVLEIGRIVNIGFEQPYILGNKIVSDYSEVISTFVFHVGLEAGRFDTGTAVGLFQSVVGVVLLLGANAVSRRITETSIW